MTRTIERALSPEENEALLRRAKDGDKQAREDFFRHNERLVMHMVKKLNSNYTTYEDRYSAAYYGFLKAYNTFDFAKGIKFATYATRCMSNEILMHMRDQRKLATRLKTGSLDFVISTDSHENELKLEDVTPDLIAAEEFLAMERQDELTDVQRMLNHLQKIITPNQYKAFVMYTLQDKTQREVGDAIGISQSYVSRMAKQVTMKLRLLAKRHGVIEKVEPILDQIHIKQEDKEMPKFVDVNALNWFYQNTVLYNEEIAKIMNCNQATVSKYRDRYKHASYEKIESIEAENMYEKFLDTIDDEHLYKIKQREARQKAEAPSEVKSSKLSDAQNAQETRTDATATKTTHNTLEAPTSAQSEAQSFRIYDAGNKIKDGSAESKSNVLYPNEFRVSLRNVSPHQFKDFLASYVGQVDPNALYEFSFSFSKEA